MNNKTRVMPNEISRCGRNDECRRFYFSAWLMMIDEIESLTRHSRAGGNLLANVISTAGRNLITQ